MNAYKLNWIMEYIKAQTEFPFDVMDVDESVDAVLAYYGIHPRLDDDERTELRRELGDLAWRSEVAEIVRLVMTGRGMEWARELPDHVHEGVEAGVLSAECLA